jgi:N-acetylmuramoyl-L-alanine amidase
MMANGTVVIDPGHGGNLDVGGSSKNNAVSPSGMLEKNITLRLAFLVRDAIQEVGQTGGHDVRVILTRDSDINLSLSDRAKVGKNNGADIFLSIHCNGFNGMARGTETLISPPTGNSNHADDKALAQRIQSAVFHAIRAHDANAKDRGVKDQKLGVLNEANLGTSTRGCMVEIEFIDVPAVDTLLNIGPNVGQVRSEIAKAIANAIIADLQAHA